MKKRMFFAIIGVVVVCAAILSYTRRPGRQQQEKYSFVEVQRGHIQNTVSATGTLQPVTTVDVGTQVSGIIDRLYVDFNDRVKRNQLLAVLDTTILSVQVRDARANLLRAEAQYEKAKYDYERTGKLFRDNLLSELEYVTSKTNYTSALATVRSAETSLERAERNMHYAFIRSPIDGTIIFREVEQGQTVASSFQTPRLFLIAEDLSKMEIHALVDESDIGLIRVGQSVRFDVQAYDAKSFTGRVRQVWLQPQTVQNVVNYTVVVDADNPDGLLLPGMTASLDFIIEDRQNVLMVSSSALRIQPTERMMAAMQRRMQDRSGSGPDSTRGRRGGLAGGEMPQEGAPFSGMGQGRGSGRSLAGDGLTQIAMLWSVDEKGQLEMQPVRTGTTDGRNTEIIPLRGEIIEGMQVIGSVIAGAGSQNAARSSSAFGGGFSGPPRRM
ncbi:MAG TPA: efflux RND transporter periplasmic adaptor subunit [bacterium]|nr:efflux RND transporter periplasmic adaptor subunit [bacterium]